MQSGYNGKTTKAKKDHKVVPYEKQSSDKTMQLRSHGTAKEKSVPKVKQVKAARLEQILKDDELIGESLVKELLKQFGKKSASTSHADRFKSLIVLLQSHIDHDAQKNLKHIVTCLKKVADEISSKMQADGSRTITAQKINEEFTKTARNEISEFNKNNTIPEKPSKPKSAKKAPVAKTMIEESEEEYDDAAIILSDLARVKPKAKSTTTENATSSSTAQISSGLSLAEAKPSTESIAQHAPAMPHFQIPLFMLQQAPLLPPSSAMMFYVPTFGSLPYGNHLNLPWLQEQQAVMSLQQSHLPTFPGALNPTLFGQLGSFDMNRNSNNAELTRRNGR